MELQLALHPTLFRHTAGHRLVAKRAKKSLRNSEMVEKPREYGEVPHWSKTGPITAQNYKYRAELHCKSKTADRNGTHPTIQVGTDEFRLWRQYFERHLGSLPVVMERMLQNPNDKRYMTIPEELPQWFDSSFTPDPRWQEREYVQMGSRPEAREPIPEGQSHPEMIKKHGVPTSERGAA